MWSGWNLFIQKLIFNDFIEISNIGLWLIIWFPILGLFNLKMCAVYPFQPITWLTSTVQFISDISLFIYITTF